MEQIYFGTYTKRESHGIYRADFDNQAGRLTNLQLLAEVSNPTYLTMTKDGCLYSIASKEGQGGVASFGVDLHPLNHVLEDGAAPCYLGSDDKRGLVFSANYHTGQALIYKRQTDGQLSLVNRIIHQGSGPHPHQDHARVHFADLTPDRYLLTCDLGTDELTSYALNDTGQVQPINNFQLVSGSGPRHVIFHPIFKHAFVVCELNSTVQNLIYQGCGSFENFQSLSSIPKGYTAFNAPAAAQVTQDGWFLYVSNRGHNSIACYQFTLDGYLHLIDIVPTHGQTPRDISLTSSEDYLLVPHQDSDNVTVFKRDKKTGHLNEVSHDFRVPEAVCVIH
ncbi:lactonase family protein [Streptococcus dentasini]